MKLIKLSYIFFFLFFFSINAVAQGPTSGILCQNLKNTVSLEFIFKSNEDEIFANAFKRVNGKFIEVGKVVGQKPSSFILFEDKYAYLGIDFAWHLDKVTKNLKPIILSEGTIKMGTMPERLSCISKNFWY
jgi:hypothetical protein